MDRILCRGPTVIPDFQKRTDSISPNSRAKWTSRSPIGPCNPSELDIIAGNSTDGLIAALDLFQLADDKHYFPPYQAVFIARQDAAATLSRVFAKLNNAISTEEMRRLNYEVDGNKRTPKDVAAEWIAEKRLN